jgi:hypothetical protein
MADTSAGDRTWRAYEMAITLLEHDTQNQWALFATFFVPQAVLLGLALQSLSPDPKKAVYLTGSIEPAFAVGVFGLLMCVPTLITHARSNLMARLRIGQALDLERHLETAQFLHEGNDFVNGNDVRGLKLSWYMKRPLNNTFYLRLLVVLWAVADAVVAWTHLPSGLWATPSGVAVGALLAVNGFLLGSFVATNRKRVTT